MKVITLDGLHGHGLAGAVEDQLDALNVQIDQVDETIARATAANRAGTLTLGSADEIRNRGGALRNAGDELYARLRTAPGVSAALAAEVSRYSAQVAAYVSSANATLSAQGGTSSLRLGLAIAGSLAAVTIVGLALVYRSSIRRWVKRRSKKSRRRGRSRRR